MRRDLHEENRLSWNAATRAHNAHKRDQAGFLRRGGSTLFPEEIALLGPLAGRRLVHLCCNAGQDTLSLVRLGAEAVGIDISDEAIGFATRLSEESGIVARFERDDIYDWLDDAARRGERFDVCFSSYGALCWLSDLDAWARSAARVLVPGGRLVAIEFHPFAMMFESDGALRYPYFCSEPWTWDDGVGDYVGAAGGALSPSGHVATGPFVNPHRVHEFLWTIGDVVTAVCGAGLTIERLEEFPYSNGCNFNGMLVPVEGQRFATPEGTPDLPLMWAFSARL